ncbi:hypothetical protein NA57DRAFT_55387 [Rhizodiscina lignyota]|uniref:IEC3 subunit of the Ino80 complex, chromatin re-modelling-domain-containing protein n=1 Tax=Rhizodiscina lignyota TaxID=1504668 RepID=A0A9P4M9J1_9PEZI|nr:hypothetical protein NA57DRAFT_55387 [Rhizodiscina lignyota]
MPTLSEMIYPPQSPGPGWRPGDLPRGDTPERWRHGNRPTLEAESKTPIRSWRKKFRKMKMRFDRAMDESNAMYREEQNAMYLAKRLQEQNDQLLDLLLDINDEPRMPTSLRFNLHTPPPPLGASDEPLLEPDDAPKPLSALETTTPHSKLSEEALKLHPELTVDQPLGYYDPAHEEEYLTALDAILADPSGYPPDEHTGRPFRAYERAMITDKEISLKNPMSVTNWLRRNQPDVFLQDKYEERASAKASRQAAAEAGGNTGGHRGKRASLASVQTPTAPKNDHDTLDDEIGFVPDAPFGSGRGKRNKDDEPYRPKGGSSRPTKRKREDGEKGGRKKSRTSVAMQEDAAHDEA